MTTNPNPAPLGSPDPDTGATAAPGRAPRGRNTLAVVALVVALLALLFSVLEGAYIVGWVLLPVAFVLSIVALTRRNQPKGLAIGALVVSLIAGVAAPVAFLGSLGRAVEKAAGGKPSVVASAPQTNPSQSQTPSSQGPAQSSTTTDAPAADAPQGTRENPYPIGTEVATERWKIKVNSFTADATDKVLAANEFNKKPEAGKVYSLVNLTATSVAQEKQNTLEISVAYVTADGNVVDPSDSFAVAPSPFEMKDVYTNAKVTGNVELMTPKGDKGLIRVRPGLLADEVFFALK